MMTYTPLDEIEAYFKENKPTKKATVHRVVVIDEPSRFVDNAISFLRANPKNKTFNPYFLRLHAYYLICKEQ